MQETEPQQQHTVTFIVEDPNAKQYLVVENGKVTNFILASPEFAEERGYISIEGNEHVTIGFLYENGVFKRNLEREWLLLRKQRNEKLRLSDEYMYPDRFALLSEEKQQELLNYRQILRDLPNTLDDPAEYVFPELSF